MFNLKTSRKRFGMGLELEISTVDDLQKPTSTRDFISLKNEFENERCTMQKCSIRKEFLCKINLVLSVS